ncbi:MAG: hypothetical protein FOGNACKC_00767 [Anaerolineae bacterium]|nr:hypothetical protein [Anaerolineae bacterium]
MSDQLARWRQFSEMVLAGVYPNITPARRQKLLTMVDDFLSRVEITGELSWDQEPDYICDQFDDKYWLQYGEDIYNREEGWTDDNPRYFFNQLRLIVRGGLNLLTGNDNALLVNVGQARAIFGGEFPAWFLERYEHLTADAPDDRLIII